MNARNVAAFALGPIGTAAVSLVTVPVIAWYFPAGDVGRVTMLQVGISFCLLLFSFGLDQSYVREYHGSENKPALFRACLLPGLGLLTTCLAVMFFQSELLAEYLFGEESRQWGMLAIGCFLCAFLGRFFSLILRMQERGVAFSLSQLLPKVGFLGLLGLWVAAGPPHGFVQLLASHTVTIASVALVFGWNTRKVWWGSASSLSSEEFARLLRFGMPLVFSGVAFWAMTSLDRIFLRNLSTFEQLGLYSVANSFAGAALVLQGIFSTIWAPMAYRWHTEGADPRRIHQVSEKLLAVVILMFAFGGLCSWLLAYILPPHYRSAQFILAACLTYPLLYTLGEATGIGLGIKRRSGLVFIASLVALAVNVAVNCWLVPLYGAAGAASATALSFLILFILRTELSSRLWTPLPRLKAYLLTTCSTALAVAYALAGNSHTGLFNSLWAMLLGFSVYTFRGELRTMIDWARFQILRHKSA